MKPCNDDDDDDDHEPYRWVHMTTASLASGGHTGPSKGYGSRTKALRAPQAGARKDSRAKALLAGMQQAPTSARAHDIAHIVSAQPTHQPTEHAHMLLALSTRSMHYRNKPR